MVQNKAAEVGVIPKGTMELVSNPGCVIVFPQDKKRGARLMAQAAPIEVTVKVEIDDESKALIAQLVRAAEERTGRPGVVHEGDHYIGLGGYGSQER